MNDQLRDALLSRYLDGELGELEIRRLALMLREDPEARRELSRFEGVEVLAAELRRSGAPPPPPDLTDRVMARITTRPPPQVPAWRRLAQWLGETPWHLAGASAAAVLFGLVVGAWLALPAHVDPGAAPDETQLAAADGEGAVLVHFVLRAPEAAQVTVAGSFNAWSPEETPMRQVGEVWRVSVPLEKGHHEYQFVVDGGTWVVDPAAPHTVEDGFGGRNGVISL